MQSKFSINIMKNFSRSNSVSCCNNAFRIKNILVNSLHFLRTYKERILTIFFMVLRILRACCYGT